jgi:hypothetical protein
MAGGSVGIEGSLISFQNVVRFHGVATKYGVDKQVIISSVRVKLYPLLFYKDIYIKSVVMSNWRNNRKNILIKCHHCDKTYEKDLAEYKRCNKLNRNHYCSIRCRIEDKKNKDIKNCKFCGEKLEGDKIYNIFCDRSCSAKYNNKNREIKARVISPEGMENIIKSNRKRHGSDEYHKNPKKCLNCEGNLLFKRRRNKYCSIKCKLEGNKKNRDEYSQYKLDCQFKFNLSDYQEEFNFELIKEHGWYSPSNSNKPNIKGISRDHIISVHEGYERKIDPKIISHPANCNLMVHSDNISKNKRSDIELEQLLEKIELWDKKYPQKK